jgi:chromosome segregation ATPase
MRSACRLLLFALLALGAWPLWSQPVILRPTELTLFEQQLPAYRFTLQPAPDSVQRGIRRYYAAYPFTPLVFEDLLLYERVSYPPISTAEPITLYFQPEALPGGLTELTVAALYDYQTPIFHETQPDLALRLLLDLSELVRSLSGDSLQFEGVLTSMSLEELTERYEARREQNTYGFYVERLRDWVGDEGETRVKADPFSANRPENFDTEDKIVAQLSARLSRYQAQVSLEGKEAVEGYALRDSLREQQAALARRNDSLRWQQRRIDSLQQALAQRPALPPSDSLQTLLAQADSLTTWRTEAEQLRAEVQAQRALALRYRDTTERLHRELGSLEQAQSRLERDSERMSSRAAVWAGRYDSLQQVYRDTLARVTGLRSELARLAALQETQVAAISGLSRRYDSLQQAFGQQRRLLTEVQRRSDSLRQEVSVLDPGSEVADVRRDIYLRQLAQLEAAQQRLAQREWELDGREKRVTQREKFLAETEADRTAEALLIRITGLEAQVDRLTARAEQVARSPEVRIEPATIDREGVLIPGFAVKSPASETFLREQLMSWFRLQDLPLPSGDPLRAQAVPLPGIEEPLDLRLAISSRRGQGQVVFCTFRRPSGQFLDPAGRDLDSARARALLQEIFR